MFIKKLEVGFIQANCFIIADEKTKDCAIIDPGGNARDILRVLEKNEFNCKYIINTHGHIDHTFDNKKIKEATKAPLLIHKLDKDMLCSPSKNFSSFIGFIFKSPPADKLLEDGDKIKLGKFEITVLHTPGHTPGGICLKVENVVFTGDTLFAGSVGRTDLPGGSWEQLLKSIEDKLLVLPDDTIIHTGHGPSSTIGDERRTNPFLTGD